MLLTLIPKLFYADVEVGIDLFTDGVGMQLLHRDDDLVILGRDRVKVYLAPDAELAMLDRPELAIETDSIDADFAAIAARRPDLLHPNLPAIRTQSWGAREFALLDSTSVCVVYRQWR